MPSVSAESAAHSKDDETRVRWELLTNVPFLLSIALLALNDHVLKAAFGGAFTGKLSDFAGVFAFGVFLCALMPARGRTALVLAGAWFALWKSPLSQPLIDGWNAVGLFDVGRVVDYTDLLALAMLPIAGMYAARTRPALRSRILSYAAAAVALVVFTATSRAETVVPMGRDYAFNLPPEDLLILMDLVLEPGYSNVRAGARPNGVIDVFLYDPDRYLHAELRMRVDGDSTNLHLISVLHRDFGEPGAAELRGSVEKLLIDPLRRAAANDSMLTLVRLTERPRRPDPISAKYFSELVSDRFVFGANRFQHRARDTMSVVIANMTAASGTFNYCEVARDRLQDGGWVSNGRAFDPCSSTDVHLDPGQILEVPFPTTWAPGIYRMRAYFRAVGGTVEVATDPIIIDPDS